MAEELTIVDEDFILLLYTNNVDLIHRVSESVRGETVRLKAVDKFADLIAGQPDGQIITIIIGSDVTDPVQSAQRLHGFEKHAKIILIGKTEKETEILRTAIRFSPFIGMEVICIDESNDPEFDELNTIVQDSLKAVKYRMIISEANSQLSSSVSSQKQVYNQHFINKLMDIAPIGIAIVNSGGIVLGWNKEATSIFDMNESEILGSSFSHFFASKERSAINKYLTNCCTKEQRSDIREAIDLKRTIQDDSTQFLNITAAPFTFSGEPDEVLILTIKDITARKVAETKLQKQNRSLRQQAKELAASNAELEQFAFVASHDLQEPLRMITGFLSRLEKKYDSVLDEKGKKYIYFATDGARRMRHIILDLLEFSRLGRVNIEKTEVDMNELVEEVLSLNKRLIMDKKPKFEIDNLPVITADKGQMRQLIQNLLNNAIKYQKEDTKPVIKISFKEKEKYWHFHVKDNGIGINEEYADKIFNIFQRLHANDEYSGTGMGLAICKKIVEVHGGEIWVESEEGKGSTFYFSIKKLDKSTRENLN